MAADPTDAIEALLVEAQEAHGAFETTELNGVYDEQWPAWYSAYAVDHGLGTVLVREVTAEQLAEFLARTNEDLERSDPRPTDSWARYTARRIAAEL
jgi:hypothetical protein